MESCLHTVQACTPWQRLKVSEHTGETPFRKWESSWMACLLFLGLSQPQIPPGSLPNFKFCPSFSMVRWLAAAAGPKSLRLWVFLSFIIGWERVDFANQRWACHLNLWPENRWEKMQFPFRMSPLAQLLLPNISWQKGLQEALSAQAPCWVGGCWIWSSEQQKGS